MHLVTAAAVTAGSLAVRVLLCGALAVIIHRLGQVSEEDGRGRRYGALALATFLGLWLLVIATQGFPPDST